ncbi:MAG TPA: hypothetical protein VFA18_22385, partial [Gemmataceae bacterium]|nr:hypothetical protein [Gemmataceae bacterium]
MTTGSVTRLVNELRSANPAVRNEAARQIWLRYVPQLLELARQHLHRRVRVREDEEDVVVSIYKSLCRRMKDG